MDFSISDEELARRRDVFAAHFQGRIVWVKKRRPPENPHLLLLQRITYALTGLLLALPPGPRPGNNIAWEAARLKEAGELGVPVPAVLHLGERYCLLEHVGRPLCEHVAAHPEEREALVARAAAELRRMHDLGLAHGGAQVKNITVLDGKIFFIDLEENIPPNLLERFQLRDLFLFLLSLEQTGNDPDLRRVCAAYGGDGAEAVLARMIGAIRQLRAARVFQSRLFARWRLRDIRSVCALVDKADRERGRLQGMDANA